MSFEIRTTSVPEDAANFIILSILKQLELDKLVLFFITGGSAISVGVKVAQILREHPLVNLTQNLTITLTDERYGEVDHVDSNWRQLMDKGFSLPPAKLIPVLTGDDLATATLKFNKILGKEFKRAEYRIGLFGIGKDGHVSGILPESEALQSEDLAFSYSTPTFSRITTTPKAIEKLDEAVVWAQGQDKWIVIEDLEKDINIEKQPAQILKKVPILTIFTDYKKI